MSDGTDVWSVLDFVFSATYEASYVTVHDPEKKNRNVTHDRGYKSLATVSDMHARRVAVRNPNAFRRREKVFEALIQERRACLTSFGSGVGALLTCAACVGELSDIPICSVAEGRWCLFHSHTVFVGFPCRCC